MPPFQITVSYVKPRGWFGWKRSSPDFPALDGWTLHPEGKASSDGSKKVNYHGEDNLPATMETLFSFLEGAVQRGEIEKDYAVALFKEEEGEKSLTP